MSAEGDILRFARGYRLQHDCVRTQWVIQAPEKAFVADPIAGEVLQLVDGQRSVGTIIDLLAEKFTAPRGVIAGDVLALVSDLTDRRVLVP
ncbi:pyrrolo-quinoline quinone synthesis protein PqqD [Ameyamaea chiangmaiensis NBRC 103196]|uniref:Pyrroloquinoline quinone biosynthesis peptide chaperone PqqD n=1 Tax=Ameyamaea chiangmaiensis TaxID=442969 RepID=A0A850PAN8_9PROT|nr:pyrroloquinoline quinone biosynthesis peptide chaperone PqqD [Ameyamaea chiangmaiensis]MBS4075955.1 pyrroloquinoline quinone biosynthesis peptide chaperone PqqD [Ameyamaea chiangmaiensis]NVN39759.1 pyrroloquinoline quinone biosynthesis peptide chaperone PqqD [Ameyamaea chiangmaiensis]GBQ61620.1 pyrrolo-quinoline quinone synthesis protein PqqD [Ameyamaea chiangmaiensis NBRC 103196]